MDIAFSTNSKYRLNFFAKCHVSNIYSPPVKTRDWGPVAGLEKAGFGSGPQKTQVCGPGFGF